MKRKIATLILFGAMMMSLAACSNPEGENTTPQGSNEPEVNEPANSPSEAVTENPNLAIGDTAEIGSWSVSVTSFEYSTRIDNGYSYFSPDDGNQYAVVSMTVTNNGTSSATFWPSFSLGDDISGIVVYDGKYEYSSTQLLAYDDDLHDESMNPLTTASGVIVFEVPETVVNGEGTLTITISAGSDSATFSLR